MTMMIDDDDYYYYNDDDADDDYLKRIEYTSSFPPLYYDIHHELFANFLKH